MMSKSHINAGADSGWNVVGRRGRAAAVARGATSASKREGDGEREEEDEEEEEEDAPPPLRPSRPTSSRVPLPRPHSRVVTDLVSSVRGECEREVFGSRAWRSLMARLDESEEDFAEEEEEEEEEEAEKEKSRRGCDDGAPPRLPFSFRNVSKLTVLGLGSLEGSRTSRLQAALALLLARERFPRIVLSPPRAGGAAAATAATDKGSKGQEAGDRRNRCRLFAADPVFTAADRDSLAELGFSVVAPEEAVEAGRARRRDEEEEEEEEEEEAGGGGGGGGGKDRGGLSFFYLPHCYPPVSEEVLKAHWNRDDIKRVAILGNSLSSVAEKAEKMMRKGSPATAAATATPRCVAAGSKSRARAAASSSAIIEASVVGPDLDAASARSGLGAAFNDTALHLFPRWTKEFAEII